MALNLNPGDKARVRIAMYPLSARGGDNPENVYIMRGQVMELTEEDLARSDAAIIWEPVDASTATVLADPGAEAEGDDSVLDYNDPDYDALEETLRGMSLRKAKAFLSRDEWTVVALGTAREAEASGRNREPVIRYIDDRIEQLSEEEATPEEDATEGMQV